MHVSSNKSINVIVLGHWGGNIGHEMMAFGVELAVREALHGRDFRIHRLEQHQPFRIYPAGHPLRLLNVLGRHPFYRLDPLFQGIKRTVNRDDLSQWLWKQTRARAYDLAITAGGPAMAPSAFSSGTDGIIMIHLHGAFKSNGIPVLNLSLGSAFPLERVPHRLEEEAGRLYLSRMVETSSVITVRDPVASQIMKDIGSECPLIACPATVCGRAFEVQYPPLRTDASGGTIILNYQRKGANNDWGQGVDAEAWADTLRTVITRLKPRHQLEFVCHNLIELRLAEELAPDIPRHYPRSLEEYAALIARAKAGLVSRIHAAIPLASIGVAAIAVGTDSRLGTVEHMGLPAHYVKDVTADVLVEALLAQLEQRKTERERLRDLREETAAKYVRLVRANLGSEGVTWSR